MATSLSDRAGFLIVANLVKYAVGFVMPMVLVRLLSQSDYGTYQQMILLGNAAIGVLTLGLPTSVYYFYHFVSQEKSRVLILQTASLLAFSGVLATAVVFLKADYFAGSLNNPSMAKLLSIYAFSLAFTIGSEHCLHFMIAQNRYTLAVFIEVAETIIRVLLLLAPLYLGYGFDGLVVGIVVYAVFRFVTRNGYLLIKNGMPKGWYRQTFVSEQMAYSVPVALVTLSGMISSSLNRGMLANFVTPAHYAIYAVGALEIPLDVIFQASVANVLRASLPPLVRDGNLDEVTRVMREAVRKLSIIVLPSFVFLLGHSYQFITLLFTSHYEQSVYVFQIYLWLVPLHMMVSSLVPQVFGKPRINFYIVVIMSGLLLLLGYTLLKTIGFYGPALAVVIVQYIQAVVYLVIVLRLTKSKLTKVLPLQHMVKVLAAAGVSLLVSVLVSRVMHAGLLNLVAGAAAFSMTFFPVAGLFKVFSGEDIRLIKRWLGKIVGLKLA